MNRSDSRLAGGARTGADSGAVDLGRRSPPVWPRDGTSSRSVACLLWLGCDDVGGRVQGFDDLYAAAYPRLVAELTLITGSAPEAEDVVQEAFARALGRWRAVRNLDEPSAWVRRVALRLAVSRWRRHQVAAAGLQRLRAAPALPKEPDLEDVYLLALMASVPLQQRAALVLHYLLDLPLAEIAEILGVPIGTVKSRLARGRVALARELREVDRA